MYILKILKYLKYNKEISNYYDLDKYKSKKVIIVDKLP